MDTRRRSKREMWRMGKFRWVRLLLLAGLMLSLPWSDASAVSIDLRPHGPTTIKIGETLNVDVFMLLDASDQAEGIGAATLHIEKGSAFVDVTASGVGSVFLTPTVNPDAGPNDFIVFCQFRTPTGSGIQTPEAFLGTIELTGRELGSYDMLARRFGSFPLITAPGDIANRYDFLSDESLTITIIPEPGTCAGQGGDTDGDEVCDDVDNCIDVANPRVTSPPAWMTLTGGQRDDDADGYGNECDGKFDTPGSNVGPPDVLEFVASLGKNRETSSCGTSGTDNCARYDLDGGAATNISLPDVNVFIGLLGALPGPRCAGCPLP